MNKDLRDHLLKEVLLNAEQDDLDRIRVVLNSRQETLNSVKSIETLATLYVGDKVITQGTFNPQKLSNQIGVVEGFVEDNKVTIRIAFPKKSEAWNIPAHKLKKVT